MRSPWIMLLAGILALVPMHALTADADGLSTLIECIEHPELDPASSYIVQNLEIELPDTRLLFDDGSITFFKPLAIDSVNLTFGALFTGRGRLLFEPSISMEWQQLRRFLKADSLHRQFASMVLLFDTAMFNRLRVNVGSEATPASAASKMLKDAYQDFSDDKARFYFSQTLQSLLEPAEQPLLIFMGNFGETGTLRYCHLPYEQEQVQLSRREQVVLYQHEFQTVCSYATEADEARGIYNGIDRTPLQVGHYDIRARIKRDGTMEAMTTMRATVKQTPARFLSFYLDPEMKVDSITDPNGQKVSYTRYKDSRDYYGLHLLLEKQPQLGDSVILTFHYTGDVAEKELGLFFVFAGARWYPHHSYCQKATFDMSFFSPADYSLIACGQMTDSSRVEDEMFTRWAVTSPAANVSFNIGFFKHYDFAEEAQAPIDIYLSEDLHGAIASLLGAEMIATGRHMELQVSDDLRNSMKVYEHLFGPYRHDRLVVSEILMTHSEAFPGFLHLGFDTWINTDGWGFQRMHRAHEAAHQWWGAGVNCASYRDDWLSEGFADYSSLIYLQQVAGNGQFLDRLDEYRKNVLAERKNAAAVALGYRAGNFKDPEQGFIILYEKGAYVLHMLRNLMIDLQTMKEDAFFALMKEFYQTYCAKTASTRDFKEMCDKYAGQDMSWFFDQWVYNNYIPTYNCKYEVTPNEGKGYSVTFRIEQKDVPGTFKMYLPVEIELDSGNKGYLRFLVDQPVIERQVQLPAKPKKIRFNPFHSVLADIKQ